MLNSNYFEQIISTMKSLYIRVLTAMLAHTENEVTGPEVSPYTYKH